MVSKNVSKTKQPGGTNSFVAPGAFHEFQIDLLFINDLEEQKFKVGMVCIDIFSKFAAVVPIMSKDTGDLASGISDCLKLMGKTTDQLHRR